MKLPPAVAVGIIFLLIGGATHAGDAREPPRTRAGRLVRKLRSTDGDTRKTRHAVKRPAVATAAVSEAEIMAFADDLPFLPSEALLASSPEARAPAPAVAVSAPGPAPRLSFPQATPETSLVAGDAGVPIGFVAIPEIHTAFRLSGFLKLDVIHDVGPYSGDSSDLPDLSLRGTEDADRRTEVTRMHARESRIGLGTVTDTPAGPALMYIETDFYAGGGGSSSYNLRMRHAYVSWQYLLAGQTWSNFIDRESRGDTIEFNGATSAGNARRAQVRITVPVARRVTVAVAAENGATDYTDPKGNRVTGAQGLDALGSGSVQQLPELTGQLRYTQGRSYAALRAMGRQLRVLRTAGSSLAGVRPSYGLGLSGILRPAGRSGVMAQVVGGRGLGGYIDDLDGQSATFDATGTRFDTQLAYGGLVSYEAIFSDHWRSNLVGSMSGVALSPLAPVGPDVKPLSTRFVQLFANVMYQPIPPLSIGLEYGYFRRETNVGLVGWSHRFQIGIFYRFGA
jgi:outer membrane DcaP-like protein